MRRNKKYQYILVIQGNYGGGWGWNDLSEYEREDWRLAKSDFRAYREAEPEYNHRLINRRVLNTQETQK